MQDRVEKDLDNIFAITTATDLLECFMQQSQVLRDYGVTNQLVRKQMYLPFSFKQFANRPMSEDF